MIKLERVDVMNFSNAIRGMRNPMNSWGKSDSYYDDNGNYVLGEDDLSLAVRLAKAGSDDRKFLRQIFVSVDVTAPLYWWKEYDTYKVGTVANSTSTMHKIHSKVFTREDFSCERMSDIALRCLDNIIVVLEDRRGLYNATKERQYWDDMIQLLPTSYNQMRTCTLNYENLLNMYYARRYHKLKEWREFCEWIETLPWFKKMCLEGDANE
jgi:hypothetical protein